MAEKAKLLVEHYQKTYELTYKLWSQRNRIFLYLVAVVGFAALITYRPADTHPLLVAWLAKVLGIMEPARIEVLQQSFPFALLQGILLIVVFYLMVNLFHRALYVLRSYAYLGALEQEIRELLNSPNGSAAFTRESDFYWCNRPWLLSTVKWAYVVLLGGFLCLFLCGRFFADLKSGNKLLVWVDVVVSVPIIVYYLGYAWYMLSRDSAKAFAGKNAGDNPSRTEDGA